MRIVIGSDHAGFELKKQLASYLSERKHEVLDVGTHSTEPVDYPDYAEALGKAILNGRAERGVLICGSGVGASVAANKMVGIRGCRARRHERLGIRRARGGVCVSGGAGSSFC